MAGIGHNTPEIDWGYHAREKVIDSHWISTEGIKQAGLQERDITLYFIITHKLRLGVENVQLSASLASKLMRESKPTAYRRLLRLTECGLLKCVSVGTGKRGSTFSGNYTQEELEEIITSTLRAMGETLKSPLASHSRVKRETANVSSIHETLNGKTPNATAESDLAFHENPLAFHESGLASHAMGETTKAKANKGEKTPSDSKRGSGSTSHKNHHGLNGKNGHVEPPIMSSEQWGNILNPNRSVGSEDIWIDKKTGAPGFTEEYREALRGLGFSDQHIDKGRFTAAKNCNDKMTPEQLKRHLVTACGYAKSDAEKNDRIKNQMQDQPQETPFRDKWGRESF